MVDSFVVQVVIRGHALPGRTFSDDRTWHNVHVGLQVGRDPDGLVPGDSETATWRTEIAIVDRDGVRDFRGRAVQGKRGERFVYLTWGEVEGSRFTMFRRAKLMLDEIPAIGTNPGVVIASVGLTDEHGGPRCGRLRPPALTWEPYGHQPS
jgi:hypothetical protein